MVTLMDQEVCLICYCSIVIVSVAIATSFGIALPSWIVSQESSIWVGVAYVIIL